MAKVVVTIRIMPEGVETDISSLEKQALAQISEFTGGSETKVEVSPIAFGLKALNITFLTDEEKGSTEALETKISSIQGVNSVEVTDVRRAVG